jgi:hypothetical protein
MNNIRYFGRGGLNVKRYWIWKSCQEAAQRQIWTDERGYYFCNIVAVNHDMRGRGIGRKLFEIVTDQADREGMKCYLESSKRVPNVDIYRQMGFEMERELDCVDEEDVCKVRINSIFRVSSVGFDSRPFGDYKIVMSGYISGIALLFLPFKSIKA